MKSHQGQLISGAIQTLRTLAEVAGAALLVILTTFFMLRDGAQIWRWVLGFFPRTARPAVDRAGHLGWKSFGGYMRGQVLIALFHGISVTIVLLVLRVPLAAPLGVLVFIGSFIPLLGLTVAGALCVAVALLEHGPPAAIAVAIAIIVLVQVEGHVLQPVIMSRTVVAPPAGGGPVRLCRHRDRRNRRSPRRGAVRRVRQHLRAWSARSGRGRGRGEWGPNVTMPRLE